MNPQDDVLVIENFSLTGAREMLSAVPGGRAPTLEHQIKAIEAAVRDTPNLVFDLCRSLIETTCYTILSDNGNEQSSLRFKDLLTATFALLVLDDDERKIVDSFIGIITQTRMAYGLASHGRDALTPVALSHQAEFIARLTDTLVTYLFRLHMQSKGAIAKRLPEYEDFQDFNDSIDVEIGDITIYHLAFKPSYILFALDQAAYMGLLQDFRAELETEEEEYEENE